jgi:hypothetical protein
MSSVNQPERVTFDSINDPSQSQGGATNQFVNNYNPSILAPYSISLLRATIPNVAQPNIPDYSLVFYYYRMPNSTTVPSATYLKAIRLYPSTYVPPNAFTAYTKNRYVSGGSDFVALLNTAAATGGDNVTYNKLWVANDITFTWNSSSQTITWQGATGGVYYSNAGWNDPVVLANQAITSTADANAINIYNFDTTVSIQPTVPEVTLNLRVGYAVSGSTTPPGAVTTGTLTNAGSFSIQNANITGRSFQGGAVSVPNDTYPNLVATQCIYVYADWTVGVGQTVSGQPLRNLLAVIPVTTGQFGVIQYTPTTAIKFKRIPCELYQLRVRLLDDNAQPFNIPDSANLNLEFQIGYEHVKS